MSVLEFISPIEPWPASKRIEDVHVHKSRLILQADVLHAALHADEWERTLAFACDRGAAAWELWLLENDDGDERCAHSALTLAERSGDWGLVGEILDAWRSKGTGHERFYRDGRRRHDEHAQAFKEAQRKIARLNVNAASELLRLTGSYAERGGAGVENYFRGVAYLALGDRGRALRSAFAACVAAPHDEHLAVQWLMRSAHGDALLTSSARSVNRALSWFEGSLGVHAGTLYLVNMRPDVALDIDAVVDATLALVNSHEGDDRYRGFAVQNVTLTLMTRRDFSRAYDVLNDAITQTPGLHDLLVLRSIVALELGRKEGLEQLRALVQGAPGVSPSPRVLCTAGRVFVREGRWQEALAAFERATAAVILDPRDARDVFALNDYAVALARNGREDESRAVFMNLTRAHPELLEIERNLRALSLSLLQDLSPANDDLFATMMERNAPAPRAA